MSRFQQKVALVTGAAQGIGRRVAERLAEEGARVVLVDRSELVFELQAELALNYDVLALTADLELYAECSRIMDSVIEHFGRIDVLINNVGGTIWAKPFEHCKRSMNPTFKVTT
jgi:dihydroxycyclohexadiene carboxylate dehydrogenase